MTPSREIRYFLSLPNMAIFLGVFAVIAAVGWQMLVSGKNAIESWVMIGIGGVLSLTALIVLFYAVALRKPILKINDTGITYSPPARPWRSFTVSWDDVAHIGIDTQEGARGVKSYYLAVEARHPDRYTAPLLRINVAMYSAVKGVVLVAPLDEIFLWASRARGERLLEEIKTTFAPEIIQHAVTVRENVRVV